MLGKRRLKKAKFEETFNELRAQYENLIFENALNPALLLAYDERVNHAAKFGRDPEKFLQEELQAFDELEARTRNKENAESKLIEIRRRQLAGETFTDQIIDEYRQRIEHYPKIRIHQNADLEVAKLYGAMYVLDRKHWGAMESYLRRAFPRAGQIDRMSIEQRFWRFVATRKGRLPEELEAYRRSLAIPSTSSKERAKEAQEAVKSVAFYLHDLLEVCEKASHQVQHTAEIADALEFIQNILSDFRLNDLKRR